MRCEEHGLAAGPSGKCVVCLREARARAERWVRRLGVGLFATVSLACGALLIARLLRGPLHAPPPPRVAAVAVAAAPRASEAPSIESAAVTPPVYVDMPLTEASLTDAPLTDASADSPAPAVSTVASAGLAPSARVPNQRELMAAIRATPVSMYSTSWCPHCRRARRFFQAYGMNVTDHDVEADAQAAAELERRSGGKAVPLIDVDGRALKGFDEQATMQAVVASVERRLGMTGVTLSVARVSK